MILYTISWNQVNSTTDKFSKNQIISLTELPGHLSINDWSANKINEVSELVLLLWYSGQFDRHNKSTESHQIESVQCLATSKTESANSVVWDTTPSVTSSSPIYYWSCDLELLTFHIAGHVLQTVSWASCACHVSKHVVDPLREGTIGPEESVICLPWKPFQDHFLEHEALKTMRFRPTSNNLRKKA